MRLTQEQIDRFWSKVDKKSENECWNWLAGIKTKGGYGGFYINQIKNTASCHKISFILEHNFDWEDLTKGIVVRHSCNNPQCVNPKHLKLGTCKDNSQDMVKAGNSMAGIKNRKSKLNNKEVKEIRKKWITGKYTQRQLADQHNMTDSSISAIVNNKRYCDQNFKVINIPSHWNKLNEEKVKEIRKMKKNGASLVEIGSKFNIGQTQIYNIINRRQWKDVQ